MTIFIIRNIVNLRHAEFNHLSLLTSHDRSEQFLICDTISLSLTYTSMKSKRKIAHAK
jgi:hypothetical protein